MLTASALNSSEYRRRVFLVMNTTNASSMRLTGVSAPIRPVHRRAPGGRHQRLQYRRGACGAIRSGNPSSYWAMSRQSAKNLNQWQWVVLLIARARGRLRACPVRSVTSSVAQGESQLARPHQQGVFALQVQVAHGGADRLEAVDGSGGLARLGLQLQLADQHAGGEVDGAVAFAAVAHGDQQPRGGVDGQRAEPRFPAAPPPFLGGHGLEQRPGAFDVARLARAELLPGGRVGLAVEEHAADRKSVV